MVGALEDLVWANRAQVGWQGERLFVLSLVVTVIVFDAGKGFPSLRIRVVSARASLSYHVLGCYDLQGRSSLVIFLLSLKKRDQNCE